MKLGGKRTREVETASQQHNAESDENQFNAHIKYEIEHYFNEIIIIDLLLACL